VPKPTACRASREGDPVGVEPKLNGMSDKVLDELNGVV
jgi:hypothetical protein